IGRSDKKFCDSYCRSHWHNKTNELNRAGLRSLQKTLLRNRKIALEILDEFGSGQIPLKLLQGMGFDFHIGQNRAKGKLILNCFDIEVRESRSGYCRVVKL